MKKLLVIKASPRGENSISNNLCQIFIEEWMVNNPTGELLNLDLSQTTLPYMNELWVNASLTPAENRTKEMDEALTLSNELVAQLHSVDDILIGTPVYNYNVPAILKAYFDHVVRKGLTLGGTGEGLLENKKCTVVVASGGAYGKGTPMETRDIAKQYLKLILNVIGINDISMIAAEVSKVVDMGEANLHEYLSRFNEDISVAARR